MRSAATTPRVIADAAHHDEATTHRPSSESTANSSAAGRLRPSRTTIPGVSAKKAPTSSWYALVSVPKYARSGRSTRHASANPAEAAIPTPTRARTQRTDAPGSRRPMTNNADSTRGQAK